MTSVLTVVPIVVVVAAVAVVVACVVASAMPLILTKSRPTFFGSGVGHLSATRGRRIESFPDFRS